MFLLIKLKVGALYMEQGTDSNTTIVSINQNAVNIHDGVSYNSNTTIVSINLVLKVG